MSKRIKKVRTTLFSKLFMGVKHEFVELQRLSDHIYCWYCGCDVKKSKGKKSKNTLNQLTVDHIKPLKDGGSRYSFKNLAICCHRCNQRKDDMPMSDFLRWNGYDTSYVLDYLRDNNVSRYSDKTVHRLYRIVDELSTKLKFSRISVDYNIKDHLWQLTLAGDVQYTVIGRDLNTCLTNSIGLLESLLSSNELTRVNPSNYLVSDYVLQLEGDVKYLRSANGVLKEANTLECSRVKSLLMSNDHLRDNVRGLNNKVTHLLEGNFEGIINQKAKKVKKASRDLEWRSVFKEILGDGLKFAEIDQRIRTVIENRMLETAMETETEEEQ